MTTTEQIAGRLTAAQRRVLVACVRHHDRQRALVAQGRIYNAYYAGGADKRVARRLAAAGLLAPNSDFCAAGHGSDLIPSELGSAVARECPEWNVIPLRAPGSSRRRTREDKQGESQ